MSSGPQAPDYKMESSHLGNGELEKYHCEQQVIIIITIMKWFLCDRY